VVAILVIFGALAFVILGDQSYAIVLQLLGGIWITKTLPTVVVGLFVRWFHPKALPAGYQAMHECDLLLLLGTDFPYDKFLPTKPIVQVDIRVDNLGRRSKLDLGLWGDVRETIRALLPMVDPKSDRPFLDAMLSKHKEVLRRLNVYAGHIGKRTPMHPEPVAAALSEVAAPDAIFAADTGMCNVRSSRYLQSTKDRRLIGSFTHGSVANALPQAIGAQCA
jgi:pyruvate dehydrogenase (quinone)